MLIVMNKEKYVNSEISKKLYDRLSRLREWDKEYPLCLLAILKNDKNKQKLLNLIDNGLEDPDLIILKALSIRDKII